jgi:dolichol-phosphate mannosyltransferase
MELIEPIHSNFRNSESSRSALKISILTASLNEGQNIGIWLRNILDVYNTNQINNVTEIIIVDDGSTDGTIERIKEMKDNYPLIIKLIQRHRKMGTVSAHIMGSFYSDNEFILVMDCDLQHSVSEMPVFINKLTEETDLIIGSRYMKGGRNLWSPYRGVVSRIATFIAHIFITQSRGIKDPLSGYFVIKKRLMCDLKPYEGLYKLLLFSLSMKKNLRIVEIPVSMGERLYGESKVVNNPFKAIMKYLREVLIFWINGKRSRRK